MVNTEIRLIIFFAAKDGEDIESAKEKKKKKKDWELAVALIMNRLMQNPNLN